MGVKEFLSKLSGKGNESREMVNQMANQLRLEKIAHERQLSPNERELLRLRNEDREEMIKGELEFARKKRDFDINHNHNPLDAKNIVKTEWEILKEPSQFSKKSTMLDGENTVMKNNPKLLKSNGSLLKSNSNLMKGGSMFKI